MTITEVFLIALAAGMIILIVVAYIANRDTMRDPIEVKPLGPPPVPPENPRKPQGPRFEWDEDDNCWVLKDCVRVDHGLMWHNFEPFHAYANINLKWKNEGKSKPTTEKRTNNDKKP